MPCLETTFEFFRGLDVLELSLCSRTGQLGSLHASVRGKTICDRATDHAGLILSA